MAEILDSIDFLLFHGSENSKKNRANLMTNSTLIDLKKLLNNMEKDFGLDSLSEVERNVLYAIKDLEKENGAAKTGHLLNHEFTAKMSRVSVFRSIKTLEKLSKIERITSKRGEYVTLPNN